jgi:hypothetical protein
MKNQNVSMKNRCKIVTFICLAACILPILLVRMPVVMDFPNHLARIWILAGGHLSGPLASVYQAHWVNASTNIAVDAFGALLARALPIHIVSKILLILLFVGPPAGAALLNRSVFKSWHPWQISFFMLTWTTTSIAGFMSFQIGLAAALTAAVIDNRFTGPVPFMFLRRTLTGMLLLLIHPFSLAFFIILAWGLDIGEKPPLPPTKERVTRIIKSTVLLGAAGAIPVLILYAAGPNPPGAYASTGSVIQWFFSAKDAFKSVLSPLFTYHRGFDYILTFPLLAVLMWSFLFGKIRVHAGLGIAAAVLFILSIVAPSSIGDASWLPRRFPLMASLTLMAALRPELGWQRRRELVLAVILLAALCLRAGWITGVWMERQKDINSLYEATQDVPAGSSVLTVMQFPADWKKTPVGRFVVGAPYTKYEPAFRHMPALLVTERQIFIPTLFAIPGQHALRVLEPWREISTFASSIPLVFHLTDPDEAILHTDPYLLQWRSRFDYVLIFNADLDAHPSLSEVPEGLTLEKDAGYAALYRICKVPD